MKWIRERDALIAQTLAFVQSVTGKKDDVLLPEGTQVASTVTTEVVTVETVTVEVELEKAPPPPPPAPLPPPRAIGDFRTEMQARIANFRKHQERFEREREEYCAETLTKLRAAIRDASGPLVKK
ncbi:hypothetical protein TSA1_15640 [Bradyrhizobium nitroreducens]|uniref:Uncharacterized protein n=1 Tax=Bradyrhizobium nitroreducens TaxID=709803 RepID=A0A2M6UBU5_9BRAD|nr:hypothetical protein [Bradyrhizobium nitroreducens]PIT02039.1 hypothetical protein TSA1_15640 [Bradyrhizobium nitroreducens]